jgi:hypothetical protein
MKKQFAPLVLATATLSLGISQASFTDSAFGGRVDRNVSVAIEESNAKTIDALKISIGGVKLGMSSKEVTKILGKPRQIVQGHDDTCTGDYATLKYNRLEILMLGSKENARVVGSISTSNSSYATGEGIRSGDRINKVKKTYARFKSSQSAESLKYEGESYSGLSFKINSGLVYEINLFLPRC